MTETVPFPYLDSEDQMKGVDFAIQGSQFRSRGAPCQSVEGPQEE